MLQTEQNMSSRESSLGLNWALFFVSASEFCKLDMPCMLAVPPGMVALN